MQFNICVKVLISHNHITVCMHSSVECPLTVFSKQIVYLMLLSCYNVINLWWDKNGCFCLELITVSVYLVSSLWVEFMFVLPLWPTCARTQYTHHNKRHALTITLQPFCSVHLLNTHKKPDVDFGSALSFVIFYFPLFGKIKMNDYGNMSVWLKFTLIPNERIFCDLKISNEMVYSDRADKESVNSWITQHVQGH